MYKDGSNDKQHFELMNTSNASTYSSQPLYSSSNPYNNNFSNNSYGSNFPSNGSNSNNLNSNIYTNNNAPSNTNYTNNPHNLGLNSNYNPPPNTMHHNHTNFNPELNNPGNINIHIPNNKTQVTTNQRAPDRNQIYFLGKTLKSKSILIKCPYCDYMGQSKAVPSFNCGALLFCACCSCCWIIANLMREKDLNCSDADHYCTKCNMKLNSYSSC